MFDLIIKNGKVVTHTDVFEAEVAVKDGKIAAVGQNLGEADRVIDAEGNYIMPGCIDPHNHVGNFLPYEADLEGETRGALLGGNTMIMQCALATGPMAKLSVMEVIEKMKEPMPRLAYCDMGFYPALMRQQDIDQIPEMAEKGIHSFKFFMDYLDSYAATMDMEPGINIISNGFQWAAYQKIKEVGGIAMFHAEDTETAEWIEKAHHNDPNTLKAYSDGRPEMIEEMDVFTSCRLAEEVGIPIYQVHSSAWKSVEIVEMFRKRGNKIFLETTPVYSILDYYGNDYRKGDAQRKLNNPLQGKIKPPVRSPHSRDMMRRNVANKCYDTLATDSANSMLKDKMKDGNIWNITLDWSSAGLMLPLALDNFYHEGLLTLPEIVRMTSYNTAKIHGYAPRKGTLEPGADADIIIVDVDKVKVLKAGKTAPSWSDWCLFEDWPVKGWPTTTILRGEVVMENDEVIGKPGYGQFIPSKAVWKGYKGPNG